MGADRPRQRAGATSKEPASLGAGGPSSAHGSLARVSDRAVGEDLSSRGVLKHCCWHHLPPAATCPGDLQSVFHLRLAHHTSLQLQYTALRPQHTAVVCRRDAQHGEREGDPCPRYAAAQASGWLDYIRLDTPQSIYTALNKLWAHQPVLLQGAPLVAGLVGRWSFEQLVGAGGAQHSFRCACKPSYLRRRCFPGCLHIRGLEHRGRICPTALVPAATSRRATWAAASSSACCARTHGATGSLSARTRRTSMAGEAPRWRAGGATARRLLPQHSPHVGCTAHGCRQ